MENLSFCGTAVKVLLLLMLSAVLSSCEKFPAMDEPDDPSPVSLEELAYIFSQLPLEQEHLEEVHTAVSSSLANGYDEEYMMADLFESPGAGVGAADAATKAASGRWKRPLRSLLENYLEQAYVTRADAVLPAPGSAAEYISALTQSDAQIYWPYSEDWDGSSMPVITFDPGDGMTANIGYEMRKVGTIKEVVVSERTAKERPVWVMNRNDDSGYQTIEMLRRQDPDWGKGGSIVIRKDTKAESFESPRTLILKEFEAARNYDSWFGGASEFVIKMGSVDGFNASTEAELKLYTPSVTDFIIVVKRKYVGKELPFEALLVSDVTPQLDKLAFLVTEDDGGTRTTWKCDIAVKIQSKAYGITVDIPFNEKDDIVWRGRLSRSFFEEEDVVTARFGDVNISFELD